MPAHDRDFLEKLRSGDEAAFRLLVGDLQGPLIRFARSFCRTESVVEEAVQETWLAVIRGIDGFEGRSSLRSWIFGILANQARRHAVREDRRSRAEHGMSSTPGQDSDSPADDEDQDREPGMGANGMWETPPSPWGFENPELIMLREETLVVIEEALRAMPEAQRQVVLLRDVEALAAGEVCNILGVSETNMRVLLHRGRARVRRALDAYMKLGTMPSSSPQPRSSKS